MRTKYLLKQGKLRPVGKESKTEGSETNLPPSTASLKSEFCPSTSISAALRGFQVSKKLESLPELCARLDPSLPKPGCASAPQSPRHLLVPRSTFLALSGRPCAPAAPGKLLHRLLQMSSPTQPPASLLLAPPENMQYICKSREQGLFAQDLHTTALNILHGRAKDFTHLAVPFNFLLTSFVFLCRLKTFSKFCSLCSQLFWLFFLTRMLNLSTLQPV